MWADCKGGCILIVYLPDNECLHDYEGFVSLPWEWELILNQATGLNELCNPKHADGLSRNVGCCKIYLKTDKYKRRTHFWTPASCEQICPLVLLFTLKSNILPPSVIHNCFRGLFEGYTNTMSNLGVNLICSFTFLLLCIFQLAEATLSWCCKTLWAEFVKELENLSIF